MSTKTVLVVDDEPHIRYILESKLKSAGFVVTTANNGRDAYALACENPPDLLVTDFQMPASSGLELCTRLASNPATSEIPAIMLTARGHRISPSELAKTNIRELLPKPFSIRQVLAKIAEIFGTQADIAA